MADPLARKVALIAEECAYVQKDGRKSVIDIVSGDEFNSWTVVRLFAEYPRRKDFLCQCRCGRRLVVIGAQLVNGASRQCRWCANRDTHVTHGLSRSATRAPEYGSWESMCGRCLNPKNPAYHNYGGRGIKVHPDWVGPGGFLLFIAHTGPRPEGTSLDRIDVNGHYEPGNVRWATAKEQANNTRANRRGACR